MKRVMFICNRNAFRSSIAEGFGRAFGNGTESARFVRDQIQERVKTLIT
jgi:protein-tyrosine-phosphatase